jgi:hypothetical protein
MTLTITEIALQLALRRLRDNGGLVLRKPGTGKTLPLQGSAIGKPGGP